MLESLLDQNGGVEGPGEVHWDVDTQRLKTGDTLNLCSIDMDGGVCATIWLSVVHSELFGLLSVESQVVVGAGPPTSRPTHHCCWCCVVWELDSGV